MSIASSSRSAETAHPVLEVLANRWSPRAFTATAIDEGKLHSALEAARWAPSAFNAQPWRFIVARAGTETFAKVVGTLTDFNQVWAGQAGALIVAIAALEDEQGRPAPTAIYDLGQAVAHLSVQAHADDLFVHQMSGFDVAGLAEAFGLADTLLPGPVVAVGELGSSSSLPDALREREEAPRERRPLTATVIVDD